MNIKFTVSSRIQLSRLKNTDKGNYEDGKIKDNRTGKIKLKLK